MAVNRPVCRIGDHSTPFARCNPSGPGPYATTGSPDIVVNGIPVHRKGDLWSVHSCQWGNSYIAMLRAGAPDVLANGLETARVTDPVIRHQKVSGPVAPQLGAVVLVATGSPDTFIGQGRGSSGIFRFILGTDDARAGGPLSGIR